LTRWRPGVRVASCPRNYQDIREEREADLGAAVAAVNGYAGPILLIAPVGTADLAASGYDVVVDPNAPELLVVNATGESVQVFGPLRLEQLRPSHLGTDLASWGDLVGPLIGANAVAKVTAA
jgi:hypothetical protein